MTTNGWLQLGLYMVVLLGLAKPLGTFMAKVYTGEPTWLGRLLGPVERLCYRVMGVSPDDEMDWKRYAWSFLLFSLLSTAGGVPAAPGSGGAAAQSGRTWPRFRLPSPSIPPPVSPPTPTGRRTAAK